MTTPTPGPPMSSHNPIVMDAVQMAQKPGPLSAWLGKWIECECGWISNSGQYSEHQLLEKHAFHAFLATTYPKGEGLKIVRNESKTGWILADRDTDTHVSPRPPAFWGNKRTAMRALAALRGAKS